MDIFEEISATIESAFDMTTKLDRMERGSSHAYRHAELLVAAAAAAAQGELARQARAANLVRLAELELPGMDPAAATQLRHEAYLEAALALGLAEDGREDDDAEAAGNA